MPVVGFDIVLNMTSIARSFVDQQRTGAVIVNTEDRNDLTVVTVPEDCCGFVMGRGGNTLRSMEVCFAPSLLCPGKSFYSDTPVV
eukprot:SAG11_NODE_3349_length_2507_cov_3.697674_2_plen_85_part_00